MNKILRVHTKTGVLIRLRIERVLNGSVSLTLISERTEEPGYMMTTKSYRMDDATLERIEQLESSREIRAGRRTLETTATQILRDAVEILHRYELGRESIISPEDPRFA